MKIRWQQLKRIFSGHASREDWCASILGVIMLVLVAYFAKLLFDGVFPAHSRWSAAMVIAIGAIAWIPVSIRRLRDFGWSPLWIAAGFVPIANIGLFLILALRRSAHFRPAVLSSASSVNRPEPEMLKKGRRGGASQSFTQDFE